MQKKILDNAVGNEIHSLENFARVLLSFVFDTSKRKDQDFYSHNFGITVLDLPLNNAHIEKLVYHRIYKSGNDNIRNLLHRFALGLYGTPDPSNGTIFDGVKDQEQLLARFAIDKCIGDGCQHPKIIHLSSYPLREQKYRHENTVSFTFVRHPVTRFISAMNEVYHPPNLKYI